MAAQRRRLPNDFFRENTAGKLDEIYGEKTHEQLDAAPVQVKVAGRMMLKRVMGKASFATIQDLSGRIQLYVSNDGIGEAAHGDFKHWDIEISSAPSAPCSRPRPGS